LRRESGASEFVTPSLVEQVKAFMKANGLTQDDMAGVAQVSQPLISRICGGKLRSLRRSTMERLKAAIEDSGWSGNRNTACVALVVRVRRQRDLRERLMRLQMASRKNWS
jgi:predicted transcriptional regulator